MRVAQKCGVSKESKKWKTPLAVELLERQAERLPISTFVGSGSAVAYL